DHMVASLAWSLDDLELASLGNTPQSESGGYLHFWDMATGDLRLSQWIDQAGILSWSTTNQYLITTRGVGIVLIDPQTGSYKLIPESSLIPSAGPTNVMWSPDAKNIAVATFLGDILVDSLSDDFLFYTRLEGEPTIYAIAWNPEGEQLVT